MTIIRNVLAVIGIVTLLLAGGFGAAVVMGTGAPEANRDANTPCAAGAPAGGFVVVVAGDGSAYVVKEHGSVVRVGTPPDGDMDSGFVPNFFEPDKSKEIGRVPSVTMFMEDGSPIPLVMIFSVKICKPDGAVVESLPKSWYKSAEMRRRFYSALAIAGQPNGTANECPRIVADDAAKSVPITGNPTVTPRFDLRSLSNALSAYEAWQELENKDERKP